MKSKRISGLTPAIVAMAKAGMSTAEIAEAVNCSKTNVNRTRQRYGVPAPRHAGGRPLIDRDRIASMTRAGLTTKQIGEALGCSRRTVERARVAMGVNRPPGRRFTEEELATAEEMLADGASVKEIERTLDRPFGSLSRRLRGRGWSHLEVSRFGGLHSRLAREARRADRPRCTFGVAGCNPRTCNGHLGQVDR